MSRISIDQDDGVEERDVFHSMKDFRRGSLHVERIRRLDFATAGRARTECRAGLCASGGRTAHFGQYLVIANSLAIGYAGTDQVSLWKRPLSNRIGEPLSDQRRKVPAFNFGPHSAYAWKGCQVAAIYQESRQRQTVCSASHDSRAKAMGTTLT